MNAYFNKIVEEYKPVSVSSPKSLLSHTRVVKCPSFIPSGTLSCLSSCWLARAVSCSCVKEFDMQWPSPLSKSINVLEPLMTDGHTQGHMFRH